MLDFLSQGLNFVSAFNAKIVIFLFLICFIGELAGIFVPYLLETTWLVAGYQTSKGILPVWSLILLLIAAQLGRELGALALYGLVRSGSDLVTKYNNRFRLKMDLKETPPFKLFHKVNLLSPFSVALGRLLWLRIPLTLVLGAQRKLKVLSIGVAISTLIYDATYTILGAVVGTTVALDPIHVLPYFLVGLTVVYGIGFAIRHLINSFTHRREARLSRVS